VQMPESDGENQSLKRRARSATPLSNRLIRIEVSTFSSASLPLHANSSILLHDIIHGLPPGGHRLNTMWHMLFQLPPSCPSYSLFALTFSPFHYTLFLR